MIVGQFETAWQFTSKYVLNGPQLSVEGALPCSRTLLILHYPILEINSKWGRASVQRLPFKCSYVNSNDITSCQLKPSYPYAETFNDSLIVSDYYVESVYRM